MNFSGFDIQASHIDVSSCVWFREDTNKWKVRPSSGPAANLSFGEYRSRTEAANVGKQVLVLRSRAEAFRLRDSLGINGRGAIARAQRISLAKDKHRKGKLPSNDVVSVTVNLSRSELQKILD